MKKLVLGLGLLMLLSCSDDSNGLEDKYCSCRLEVTTLGVTYNDVGLPTTSYTITYEDAGVTNCDLDGTIIYQTNTITKIYDCD